MKPTHGFKNPLIGFGERQGRVGGGVRREWGGVDEGGGA